MGKARTPDEIWRLLTTADNFLKLGADERAVARARRRYGEALAAAEEAGIAALAEQARRRLADLERLASPSTRTSGPRRNAPPPAAPR